MTVQKRSLKDTIKDRKVKKKRLPQKKNQKMMIKIVAALVIGFAGGFGTARLIRFL